MKDARGLIKRITEITFAQHYELRLYEGDLVLEIQSNLFEIFK